MSGQYENSDYHFLNTITTILSSSLDLHDTMSQLFQLLHTHMGINSAILYLIDPNTGELKQEMTYGLITDEQGETHLKNRLDIANTTCKQNTPITLPQLLDDSSLQKKLPLISYYHTHSFICLPMTLQTLQIGCLSIICPFKSRPHFQQNVKTLRFIGLMVAQELQLTRLIDSEHKALKSENTKLKDKLKQSHSIPNMIGNSNAMQQVYESIKQVAHSNASVLIRGESGTGKELVAQAIHYTSTRADQPFIKINCGAIPESLIESELFGHEKGAFTDAHQQKIGKFEAANSGSIMLDEIAELSPHLQVKLLRVLQEREITRIGGVKSIPINVRILAATNRNLEDALKKNKLRQDLYYRLNVFPINLPPLRERSGDIMLLVDHFLKRFSKENNKPIQKLSNLAIQHLNHYDWPGNVRELVNCMERAVLLCKEETILVEHLPPTIQSKTHVKSEKEMDLKESVSNYERQLIETALQDNHYNQSKAARQLNTSKRIIGYKIKKLGISMPDDT